jgi:hypothetical protein
MLEPVQVLPGLSMPSFPMRPACGRTLTRKLIPELLERQAGHRELLQRKLNGDRVLLSVVDRRVLACNRHGGYYGFQIKNAALFLKLKDGSSFDGEVWRGSFYPFECLALDGRSYRHNTCEEREIVAMQMCRLLKITWMYTRPTRSWLLGLREHLPVYEGVVRKRADAPYLFLASDTQVSPGWIKHRW